ncbi:hypothetical protein NDU88_002887 [Pleurodeles waltl]|uniref:Uncharacterized protein n=1 Tax=Pleurodeles waltl TaxID=8319 RepID=A0AAV7W4F5_PLEWA|nr:hypothetical protein NDU88_002887 [Pleurodeles waltl]
MGGSDDAVSHILHGACSRGRSGVWSTTRSIGLARWRSQERPLNLAPNKGAQKLSAMVSVSVENTETGGSEARLWEGVHIADTAIGTDVVKGSEVGTATDKGLKGQAVEGAVAIDRGNRRGAAGVGKTENKKDVSENKQVKIKNLPYMRTSKPLGAHLMLATKEKIWKGKYVEMWKLLHWEVRAKEGSKEEKMELAKRPTVPLTIGPLPSVHCGKYPERVVALLKYMDVIRKAQVTYSGYA